MTVLSMRLRNSRSNTSLPLFLAFCWKMGARPDSAEASGLASVSTTLEYSSRFELSTCHEQVDL